MDISFVCESLVSTKYFLNPLGQITSIHDFLVTSKDLKVIVLLLKHNFFTIDGKNSFLITDKSPFPWEKNCERRMEAKSIFVCNSVFLLRMIVVDGSFPGFVLSCFIIVNISKKGYGLPKHYIFSCFLL